MGQTEQVPEGEPGPGRGGEQDRVAVGGPAGNGAVRGPLPGGGCGRGQDQVTRVAQTEPASMTAATAKPSGAGWFIPSARPGSSSAGSSRAAGLRTPTSTPA